MVLGNNNNRFEIREQNYVRRGLYPFGENEKWEHSVGQIDHILFSINRRDLPTCALRRLVYLPNSYKTLITIDISLKNNQKSSKSVMKNFPFLLLDFLRLKAKLKMIEDQFYYRNKITTGTNLLSWFHRLQQTCIRIKSRCPTLNCC